jgi:ATP-dependent protease ClpP protease subunit
MIFEDNKGRQKEEDRDNERSNIEAADTIAQFGVLSLPKLSKNSRGNLQFLPIIGTIEGHMAAGPQTKTTKYEHVIPHLIAVCQSEEIDGLLIILNTIGGDVEAGLAISELISTIGKPTVSLVLGGGHSIGVPIAVSSDYSFIAQSATMTIHPVRYNGTAIGAPQTFNHLQQIQDRITDFIVRNSGITKEDLNKLMMETSKLALDVGTIISGEEAVEYKLINEIGGLSESINKLYDLIEIRKRNKKRASRIQ